ncbi:MAG TPA: hypothetical protein ENI39_05685 [Anaerolineae bacterium]|nr:hypothetical protein [Anaerolineae bacterium]
MEKTTQPVLLLALLLVLVVLARRRRARSAARQPARRVGTLVVPLFPLCGDWQAYSRGRLPCLDCGLRQLCLGLADISAAEENEGRLGGIAGERQPQPDLVSDLERAGRLLKAAEPLLGRFIELLTLLPARQVIRVLRWLARLLLAHISA